MTQIVQTNSFEETRDVGEKFASSLRGGDIICLHGNLGAGKTTFMQGLAKGLGITHRIISPTFIILRRYEISPPTSSIHRLYHIDLYRTETAVDLEGLGIPEILREKDAVVAIEWSEKLGNLLPEKRWELDFTWKSENKREIVIERFYNSKRSSP